MCVHRDEQGRLCFPGVLDDSVRAGKLWTYLETHKLHESIWYGYALRNKRQHDISILMHPLPDQWNRQCKEFFPQTRPLHLLTAPRFEAPRAASNSEVAATELASATERMEADTESDTSGVIDYGTLAEADTESDASGVIDYGTLA